MILDWLILVLVYILYGLGGWFCPEIKGTKAVSCTIQTYSVPYTSSNVALILPSTVLYTHMIDGCICIWTLESIGPPASENGMEWNGNRSSRLCNLRRTDSPISSLSFPNTSTVACDVEFWPWNGNGNGGMF